jgi:hypothetical protein
MNIAGSVMAAMAMLLLAVPAAFAKPTCIEARGEGAVIGVDVPSARTEAVNRAKLSAVEQVAGVEVKSRTIVQDSALLDDVVTTQMRGMISSYKLLSEQREGDAVTVRISACVEQSSARTAVTALARNTSISVFIPSRRLSKKGAGEFDDENILSQAVMGKLVEGGFTVRDIAESHSLKMKEMESALIGGNQPALRRLIYKHLTNTILIGKIESTVSVSKEEDAGYGVTTPFNNVTVRLAYRLMGWDTSGKMAVLAAGTEEARGLARNTDDAHAEALKNLAERFAPLILYKIHARLQELADRVTVTVEGVKEPAEVFAMRDLLQKIAWVTNVEDTGVMGEFHVTFPENPIYLASGLSRKGFKIISYERERIRVRKP